MKITEENFERVLKKMEEKLHKYNMNQISDHISVDGKHYRNTSIGIRFKNDYTKCMEKGYGKPKKKLSFFNGSTFVHVTKHWAREEKEKGNSTIIERYNPLIHINPSACQGCALYEGDKVYFLPFGIVYIISYERIITDATKQSKYIYIPDFIKGKIDLEKEIENRNAEIEEEEDFYNEMEERALREDYYDEYGDDDDPYYDGGW